MRTEVSDLRCIGTGFIALDIVRRGHIGASAETRFAGGSCGNVLAILSFLGWQASAIGRLGKDTHGRRVLADLTRAGVDTRNLFLEADGRTPIVLQEIYEDAKGRARHRFFVACPLCGASFPRYRPILGPQAAEVGPKMGAHAVFYFDRVATGNLELAQRSRQQGALVVFEPSGVRDPELFRQCLKASHVIKYSHERLSNISAFTHSDAPTLEVQTLGADGLRFRLRDGRKSADWSHRPALATPSLLDASGSGDWCTAGFVHRMFSTTASARGVSEKLHVPTVVGEALGYGQVLATLNCGYEGARGLMYAATRHDVLALSAALISGAAAESTLGPARRSRLRRSSCGACSAAL